MNRRDMLGRSLGALAAAVVPVAAASAEPGRGPQSLRDLKTVEAGDILCKDLKAVFLDGRDVMVSAFNVSEGWVDEIQKKPFDIIRRYGKVTYRLKPAGVA